MKRSVATIYRPAYGDCTNHGISSRCTLMTVFDDCTPEEALEYCKLHKVKVHECLIADHTPVCGSEYLKLVPLNAKREGFIGPMFGGNYAEDHDERFPAYSFMGDVRLPIPIHDRYETPEEYEMYSC